MIHANVCAKHPELGGHRHNNGACPGCHSLWQKEYRIKNAEALSRYQAAHYEKRRPQKREAMRIYRKNNPEKVAASYRKWYKNTKTSGRWRLTGFTADLFQKAIDLQSGLCAICLTPLVQIPERLRHADHDHATGKPRGVLCGQCNNGLGSFRDNPESLKRAIKYLKNPTLGVV